MPGDSAYIMLCYFCNDRKKYKSPLFKYSIDSTATTVVS